MSLFSSCLPLLLLLLMMMMMMTMMVALATLLILVLLVLLVLILHGSAREHGYGAVGRKLRRPLRTAEKKKKKNKAEHHNTGLCHDQSQCSCSNTNNEQRAVCRRLFFSKPQSKRARDPRERQEGGEEQESQHHNHEKKNHIRIEPTACLSVCVKPSSLLRLLLLRSSPLCSRVVPWCGLLLGFVLFVLVWFGLVKSREMLFGLVAFGI
jgi:hypothetical protein